MKKVLITSAIVSFVALSNINIPFTQIEPTKVEAAALVQNPYGNQVAVNVKADALIKDAKALIGQATYSTKEYKKTYPYKFSCATFINFIFEKNGVDLANYDENHMMQQGVYVPREQLQKGDLVFFDANPSDNEPSDHVAMYIGDNKVIHMADPKLNIVISDMNSMPYYTDNYVTARRVLPSLMSANPATKGDKIVETAYGMKDNSTMTGPVFVNQVFKNNGIDLGTTNMKEQMKLGSYVAREDLKKGDLVFFTYTIGSSTPGMVGIYAGDHRIMVPTTNGVLTRAILYDYYDVRYITARRVITEDVVEIPKEEPTIPAAPAPEAPASPIVNTAERLIGKGQFGYSYNESTLTFTGAGFAYYVFSQNGIDLKSKLSSQQAKLGQTVAKGSLQPGDLIYFSLDGKGTSIKHVGIYAGNNEFIHLLNKDGVKKESLNSTWAQQNYVTAKRVK